MAGVVVVSSAGCKGGVTNKPRNCNGDQDEQDNGSTNTTNQQLSVLALLLAAIRKSVVACRMEKGPDSGPVVSEMEIGWPTDVRHVAHVTFDRFHGFLGLPVEFELEVPTRAPSASVSVFGVSAESMQCGYDSKGNSVPIILLLMQERLYAQEGLKAEGIFRINPENGQEEHVRAQLNKGVVPEDIDVHCLASLIKAWFRELPEGVLDGLSPEQVLQCNTEEEFVELVTLLRTTQAALLSWAVELMADVVEEEELNKMNARNIAMVFAPNMTQMSDPLTALMHAVQVMNLLKTLILRALREREEATMIDYTPFSSPTSSNECYDSNYYGSERDISKSCELRDVYAESDQDMQKHLGSSEPSRRISVDYQVRYCRYDNPLGEAEECFLNRLEWKCDDDKQEDSRSCCEADSDASAMKDMDVEEENLLQIVEYRGTQDQTTCTLVS